MAGLRLNQSTESIADHELLFAVFSQPCQDQATSQQPLLPKTQVNGLGSF